MPHLESAGEVSCCPMAGVWGLNNPRDGCDLNRQAGVHKSQICDRT